MVYVPDIIDLKPFYVQSSTDTKAKDTTEWGLVPRVNPYPLLPTPKQPFKNEWLDENGDQEYTRQMYYESMEISVGFYVKAYDTEEHNAAEVLRMQIDDFFSYIRNGEFKIYDSYTDLGRQGVRYAGYEEGTFKSRNDWASATFTVKFKINDPLTRVMLKNGALITE